MTAKKKSAATAPTRRAELQKQREVEQRARRNRMVLGIVAGIVALAVIAVVSVVAWQDWKTKKEQREREAAVQITPPNAVGTEAILANPQTASKAKYTLQLFADYQCPICGQTEETYSGVWQQLADEGFIKLEMHTMTFLDANLGNDSSTRVAIGAACADVSGRYAQFHSAAFKHQPEHEADGYSEDAITRQIAEEAGITGDAYTKWRSCLDNNSTAKFVREVDANAGKAGVTSTPTLKVNGKNPQKTVDGKQYDWWRGLPADAQAWKAAIQQAAESK